MREKGARILQGKINDENAEGKARVGQNCDEIFVANLQAVHCAEQ